MSAFLHCPFCGNHLIGVPKLPIVLPLAKVGHLGAAILCPTCPLVTELNAETGDLVDLPGLAVAHLVPASIDDKVSWRTTVSLRPAPKLTRKES